MYPLLYPLGTMGYCHLSPQQLKELAYTDPFAEVPFQLYLRQRALRDFRHFDRLTQAWLIDMSLTHQDHQLRYLKSAIIQCQARGVSLAPGTTQVAARAKLNTFANHDRVFLPHSFAGNPTHMRTLCRESLAVMARYGKPTYMVTMTANADWDEVRTLSGGDGTPAADAICRVFDYKAKALIKYIVDEKPFGDIQYYMWVREVGGTASFSALHANCPVPVSEARLSPHPPAHQGARSS
jgi:hypothetical protein